MAAALACCFCPPLALVAAVLPAAFPPRNDAISSSSSTVSAARSSATGGVADGPLFPPPPRAAASSQPSAARPLLTLLSRPFAPTYALDPEPPFASVPCSCLSRLRCLASRLARLRASSAASRARRDAVCESNATPPTCSQLPPLEAALRLGQRGNSRKVGLQSGNALAVGEGEPAAHLLCVRCHRLGRRLRCARRCLLLAMCFLLAVRRSALRVLSLSSFAVLLALRANCLAALSVGTPLLLSRFTRIIAPIMFDVVIVIARLPAIIIAGKLCSAMERPAMAERVERPGKAAEWATAEGTAAEVEAAAPAATPAEGAAAWQ